MSPEHFLLTLPGCQEGCCKLSGLFCSQDVQAVSGGWRGTPSCQGAGCRSWPHRWSCRWGTAGFHPCCHCCTLLQDTGGDTGDRTVPGGPLTQPGRCRPRLGPCTQMVQPGPPCRWCSPELGRQFMIYVSTHLTQTDCSDYLFLTFCPWSRRNKSFQLFNTKCCHNNVYSSLWIFLLWLSARSHCLYQ